jgi:hypothetical protein
MTLSLHETRYVHSGTEAFQIRTIQSVSHDELNFVSTQKVEIEDGLKKDSYSV